LGKKKVIRFCQKKIIEFQYKNKKFLNDNLVLNKLLYFGLDRIK